MVGTTVGHYQILALLGRGAMGEVYLAHDAVLQRRVALKILGSAYAADAERRHHFEREARALAALNHPGIVDVYDVEQDGDVLLLSMEYVDGAPLSAVIPREGMPFEEVVRVGAALAEALGAAHRQGIVHRDLKPANVMVTAEGAVKVLDFGLAKIRGPAGQALGADSSSATTPGTIIGTAHYMSPEQAQGLPVDARSDIFSLGILLFQMATGRRPFEGQTPVAVLSSIIKDTPPSVTTLRPDLPLPFARLVARCLEKEPRARVQDALDLAAQLRDAATDRTEFVPAPSGSVHPRALRVPALFGWLLGSVVLLALAAAGGWQFMRSRPPAQALRATRIAVAPFANRTGEASLDPIGLMVADRVAEGLIEQLGLDVVPGTVVIEAWPTAADTDTSGAAAMTDRVRRLAERVRAGVVISGDYYTVGDDLTFRGRMTDVAAGRDVAQFGPVTAPRAQPGPAVERLREYVVGESAAHWKAGSRADTAGIPADFALTSPPVTYEVYREFCAGLDVFGRDPRAAVEHLERVEQLYPHRAMVLPWLVLSYWRLGDFIKAEEYVGKVQRRAAPDDVLLVQYFSARLRGDWPGAYDAIRAFQRQLPQHLPTVNTAAGAAIALGRAQEALALLRSVDVAPWIDSTSGQASLAMRADVYHMLRQYEDEQQIATQLAATAPGSIAPLVRSLAAVGRDDEITRVIEESQLRVSRQASAATAVLFKDAADELRAHGHVNASRVLARQGLKWIAAEDRSALGDPAVQRRRAALLLCAERWRDAETLLRHLVLRQPDQIALLADLGVAHARAGHAAAAKAVADRLGRVEGGHRFGAQTLGRARIAAALGDRDRAILLLQQAFSEGQVIVWRAHADPVFEPLRGYAPFDRLTSMNQL